MKGRIKPVLEYSAALLVLLAAWWYVSGPMGMPAYLLPSPASVAELLWSMLMNGKLLPHLAFTVQNIVIGLVVGSMCLVCCWPMPFSRRQL